jgi:hypothetical protein
VLVVVDPSVVDVVLETVVEVDVGATVDAAVETGTADPEAGPDAASPQPAVASRARGTSSARNIGLDGIDEHRPRWSCELRSGDGHPA